MKARADAVFAALVFISGCAAGAVGAAIAALGAGGLAGVGAVLAGWVSACVLFVLETRRIPVLVLLVTVIGTATLTSADSHACENPPGKRSGMDMRSGSYRRRVRPPSAPDWLARRSI
jgi:hypothetical protein